MLRTLLIALLLCAGLTSCVSKNVSPYRPITFLEHMGEMKEANQSSEINPFRFFWIRHPGELKRYRDELDFQKLFIRPINTAYIRSASDDRIKELTSYRTPSKEQQLQIANYFRTTLVERLRTSPDIGVRVVDMPGKKSFIIEIALTELLVSPALVESKQPSQDQIAENPRHDPPLSGSMTVEVKFWDGDSGQLLAEAAERATLHSLEPDSDGILSYTGEAYQQIKQWSESFRNLFKK